MTIDRQAADRRTKGIMNPSKPIQLAAVQVGLGDTKAHPGRTGRVRLRKQVAFILGNGTVEVSFFEQVLGETQALDSIRILGAYGHRGKLNNNR